ncbi:MAG: glycine betaine ABC transporter substrate-binding protein [Methylocella sp.]
MITTPLTRRGVLASLIAAATAARPARALGAAPLVVATKLDLEGALLGEMMLLALARVGVATVDRLRLGPTAILRQALLSGAVDLCVEYTGNAAFFFHQEQDPVWRDALAGYSRAAELDYAANNIVWLQPAPANNNWVIAIPNALAREKGLKTLDDFAAFVRGGNRVKLAASAEFVESAAGLPAFESAYGFELDARQLLVLSGGETTATMKAAADGVSGVNAAMAYGADGALDALGLLALGDPRHAEPVYAPAPVIRAASLEVWPQVGVALAPVFAALDLETLRALNAKIAVEGEDARAVARDYLAARSLL